LVTIPVRSLSSSASVERDLGKVSPLSEIALSIRALNKSFQRANGDRVRAIDDVSFDVACGEFVVLLGPSGCGKTTLLRAVAGLEHPDAGSIRLGGRALFDRGRNLNLPPEDRRIGMVFQSYALWPHMTVAQNVAYPLRMRGIPRGERDRRVSEILEKMHIGDLGHQQPGRISGGQQQRVALARALVCGDELILFDEPLSNVDAKVREYLRLEILTMQREFGFTALYVTHDQEEAMALATRIAVVGNGKITQFGTAEEIYSRPVSLDVARFIGSANELVAQVIGDGVLDTAVGQVRLSTNATAHLTQPEVTLLTRPEQWRFVDAMDSDALHGHVVSSAFLGSVSEHVVKLDTVGEEPVRIVIRGAPAGVRPPGARVACKVSPDGPLVFDRVGL